MWFQKYKKIQKYERDWYSVIGLVNAIFSILILERSESQFAFMWKGFQFIFTILPQGYLNLPTSIIIWLEEIWT